MDLYVAQKLIIRTSKMILQGTGLHSHALKACLRGEKGNECKWMKIITLKYSSFPLFENFNGGNEKFIPLFGSLSKKEWNE